MSTKASASQSLAAGLFLIAGLAGLVIGAFWIQGQSLGGPRAKYTVVLELDTGSGGLEKDAAVGVGGKRKGRVTNVEVVPRHTLSERPNAQELADSASRLALDEPLVVAVDIEIDTSVSLHPGTKVLLNIPLLGSGGALNIAYTGDQTKPALIEGSIIVANVAPPPFLRGLDVNEVGVAVARIRDGAEKFNQFMGALAPTEQDAIEPGAWARRIDSTLANIDEFVAETRHDAWPNWKSEIDQTLANAREFSTTLNSYGDKFNTTFDEFKALATDGRNLLSDNRERVDSIVFNTESFVRDANEQWGPGIQTAVERAQDAFGEFADLGQTLGTSWESFRPNIDQTLARFRLGADQFKLFTVEVRSQPWRLLHRPDTKELESQLLYDAARSYGQAVSDLRATSASVESILLRLGSPGMATTPIQTTQLQELMLELQRTRERQAQAERRLLDMMTEMQRK